VSKIPINSYEHSVFECLIRNKMNWQLSIINCQWSFAGYGIKGGLQLRRFLLWLSLFFLITGLLLVTRPAALIQGANVSEKERIQQLIEQTKREISKKKKKEKSVIGNLTKQQQELSQLEDNYNQVVNKLSNVQTKYNKTRQQLWELQSNLGDLEQSLQQRKDLLNRRLVATYKYGPQTYLEILVSGQSYGDLISRFRTITYIIKYDVKLINEVEATKVKVGAKHQEVQAKSKQVESELKDVVAVRDEVSQEQQKITVKVKTTKEELAKIQNDRANLEKAEQELEQTSRDIEEEIKRTQQVSPGDALGSGNMIWPLRGRLSSGFGWRYHPVLKTKKYHTGQDIAVASGTQVCAADNGVVLVSGWQGGYGNFVAIDHGKGISTCYGHNSRLLVSAGSRVTKGQVIAYSGSTGLSTGPHLHFEVRVNGVPVNPLPYLP
jgi:murein DD-endopeptidase MepM/ murein hydrolase activator NlpD